MRRLSRERGKAPDYGSANPPHHSDYNDADDDDDDDDDDGGHGGTIYPGAHPAEGKRYTSLHVSPESLYILDWEQLRRLVHRCKFWYEETMRDSTLVLTPVEHMQWVSSELQKLYERVNDYGGRRIEFVRLVGDHLMDDIEGPKGLGSTSKEQFEKTVLAVLNELQIAIKVDDFDFFYRLKELQHAQQNWKQRVALRRRRRKMTALRDPASLVSTKKSGEGVGEVPKDAHAGAQSKRISCQPSCDELVQ
ncbi:hypothetical protein CAC42_4482 [Sphaceloma murrayae]|uniref:Uncharacterized protein n=1 Tax=Sphaceloma murrayae TaxID=2082308 RepID=A0A2K1QM64_9PEZI|nr:hypothetical protein CAC42_4482 [Sphaceloma murrayae]